MTATMKDIATQFAKAMQGDASASLGDFLAPKVSIFHIYDERPNEIDSSRMVAIMANDEAQSRRLMSDYTCAEVRVFPGDGGFVAERTISGTLPDGSRMFFPFCARVSVENGKIVRVDSYQDRQQGAAFREAIKRFLS